MAAWRQLLRSIWTHLRLHEDYGDNAAAHAGQHHSHLAEAALLREDLSGGTALAPVDVMPDAPCKTGVAARGAAVVSSACLAGQACIRPATYTVLVFKSKKMVS